MPHPTRFQARQKTQQQETKPENSHSGWLSSSKKSEVPNQTINNLAHSKPAPHAHHRPRKARPLRRRIIEQAKTRVKLLAAVNGVVIPSKVPLGQLPDQGRGGPGIIDSLYSCSICARKFARKDIVETHMWPCVQRNGNPNGVRWDDAWNHSVNLTGRSDLGSNGQDVDPEETESETEMIEDDKTDELQPADYSLQKSPSSSLESQPINSSHPYPLNSHPTPPSTANTHQTSPAPSSIDLPPSHLPQHPSHPTSPTLPQSTPQITSPPSVPYDANIRMDVLSNEALLLTVQAWHNVAQHLGEEYVMDHPQFQSVMDELWQRGIVDEESNWLIDVQKVDRFARRVMA